MDRDLGVNGCVVFFIGIGNDKQFFKIDSMIGEIVMIKLLDYESIKEYKLFVEVIDEGKNVILVDLFQFDFGIIDDMLVLSVFL